MFYETLIWRVHSQLPHALQAQSMSYFDASCQRHNPIWIHHCIIYICVLARASSNPRMLYNTTTAQAIQNEYFLAPWNTATDCIWPRIIPSTSTASQRRTTTSCASRRRAGIMLALERIIRDSLQMPSDSDLSLSRFNVHPRILSRGASISKGSI